MAQFCVRTKTPLISMFQIFFTPRGRNSINFNREGRIQALKSPALIVECLYCGNKGKYNKHTMQVSSTFEIQWRKHALHKQSAKSFHGNNDIFASRGVILSAVVQ